MTARLLALLLLAAMGCAPAEDTLERPDLDFNRMLDQPRYDAYGHSPWFDDRAAMRVPPEGTVPFAGTEPRERTDPRPTRELLDRGRLLFERVCAACHGLAGTGDTVVAESMELRPPPSLHTERARSYDDQELLEIVADGYGMMPGYGQHFDEEDRHAVVHYLRALQLSQNAPLAELPPRMQRSFREATR